MHSSPVATNCTYAMFEHAKDANDVQNYDIKCNITETYRCDGNTTYQGFYSTCIPGVACPIQAVADLHTCELWCSMYVLCRALAYRQHERTCLLIVSSYLPL